MHMLPLYIVVLFVVFVRDTGMLSEDLIDSLLGCPLVEWHVKGLLCGDPLRLLGI